jgi:hypothetical protein
MKKLTFIRLSFIIALTAIAVGTSWAQEVGMPAGLHEHGLNSSDVVTATENTDSVTVGSVMPYWVQPDATIPGASTFTWTISGLGVIGATTTNLSSVTYGAITGTGTISVQEIAPTTPSCPGSTRIIDFAVVNAPTANFGADPASQCFVPGPAQLTFVLPVTVVTPEALGTVRVIYTVYDPSNNPIAALTNVTVEVPEGAGSTISVILPAGSVAGTYHAQITSITDRISRKPATDIEGTFTAGNERIDMIVNPVPTTGPIFHVPNM